MSLSRSLGIEGGGGFRSTLASKVAWRRKMRDFIVYFQRTNMGGLILLFWRLKNDGIGLDWIGLDWIGLDWIGKTGDGR